jgi:hypothetical protein
MAEVSEVDAEVLEDIREYQGRAATLLQVSLSAAPSEIVTAINTRVRELKSSGTTLEQDDCIAFGVLLGEQYVRAFEWHWGEVVWDGDEDESWTCVLNGDNSVSINPIWWVNDVLTTDRSTNFLLNFNMVAAGRMPECAPNEAMGFH